MKPNQQDVVARLRTLFGGRGANLVFARMEVALPAPVAARLGQHAARLAPGRFPDLEEVWPLWEDYLAFHDPIEDDWLPAVYPRQYDQGLYGSVFGATMQCNLAGTPGWMSSNTAPLADLSYAELLARAARPRLEWAERLERDLRQAAVRSRGRWGVAVPITIDGLNLAVQVRGDQAMLDLYDCPDDLKRFLQAGVDLNIELVERQRAAIGPGSWGGVADFFNAGWMPGNAVPMSVDCYHLCRAEVYAEFGLPYQQQLIDHFGGGNFHLHGNGRHLVPELAKLNGLVVTLIANDGSALTAFDELAELKRRAGPVILVVPCHPDEFVRKLRDGSLPGGVYYTVGPVPTIDAANRLMEEVRRYRV